MSTIFKYVAIFSHNKILKLVQYDLKNNFEYFSVTFFQLEFLFRNNFKLTKNYKNCTNSSYTLYPDSSV